MPNGGFGLTEGEENGFPDEAGFQCFENGLGHGIAVAVSPAAHGHQEAMGLEGIPVIIRAILAAPARIADCAR